MADPNFAAVMETIAFAADVLDELESYTATSSTGLVATLEALRNDIEGDWAQDARAAVINAASAVNGPLTKAGARAVLDPLLRQVAVAISFEAPGGPIEDIWEALYDYMAGAAAQSINDTEDTHDLSWAAGGSNVGDGTVIRVAVDENGEVLGGFLTDAWTLECIRDAREIGQVHQEQWRLTGTDARPDNLAFTGTGLRVDGIRTAAADLSKSYVKNPSFGSYTLDGSSNLTALPGWTQVGATLATNLSIDTAKTFRTTPGESTSVSLQFDSDETVYQDLVATAGARIDLNQPYLVDVAVHREGSATGNVTLRLSGTLGSGGVSTTIALASQTADTWVRLRIAVTTADCWAKSFNANDLKLQIKVDTLAVATCLVDDIVFTPMTRIGRYGDPRVGRGAMGQYLVVAGGAVPFVKDDVFTATDTLGSTRGVNHWALSKIAQYGYLPLQTGGTETVADK